MGMTFWEKVEEDIRRYRGSRSYVHAGLLERLLVRELSPLQMHPNPEDDFCQSRIGPNGVIIEHYREIIRYSKKHYAPIFAEPIIVRKIGRHEYMILNGHHRWAATLLSGTPSVRAAIVNPKV